MQLSLQALQGSVGSKTMRITGIHGRKQLYILVDSGSTHNFLRIQTTSRLRCLLKPIEGVRVIIANGQDLYFIALCEKFEVKIQGQTFFVDVYTLPLKSYDLILGAQWLVDLGDIV